jgi:predicted ferric reductase
MRSSQEHSRTIRASALLWLGLLIAVAVPIAIAAASPLLQWRDPIYIIAGFAGIIGLALLLAQPLLVGGYLPGLAGHTGRRAHRWIGCGLLAAIVIHVAGLWLTSPPDVLDALLFRSPTPFSLWGVIAMLAAFAAALLALLRRRLSHKIRLWRFAHSACAMIVVAGSVLHAVQIEGAMGTISKAILCALALVATVWVIYDRRSWQLLKR